MPVKPKKRVKFSKKLKKLLREIHGVDPDEEEKRIEKFEQLTPKEKDDFFRRAKKKKLKNASKYNKNK